MILLKKLFLIFIYTIIVNASYAQSLVFTGEAEAADESLIVGTKACASASGGTAVEFGSVGGKYLQWNTINATEAGTYQIDFAYYSNATTINLNVQVNGGTVKTEVFAKVGFCAALTTHTAFITLSSGDNVLRLENIDGTKAPFLDKIDIYTVSSTTEVTSIAVSGASNATTLAFGGTLQMAADVLPADATDNSVTWSVTDGTGSGTIDAAGLFTGVSTGTATVVATANDGSGISGLLELTIQDPILVTSILVNGVGEVSTLEEFNYLQLETSILPIDANNQEITWSITNETGIASITSAGILVSHQAGTVTARATAVDGSAIFGEQQFTITANNDAGLVYRVEPEFGLLASGATNVALNCANKSGEGIVSYSDDLSASSEHQNINVSVAGDYNLNLSYFSENSANNPVKLNLFINDETFLNPILLEFDNVGFCSAGTSASKSFQITLASGENILIFKNTGLGVTSEAILDLLEISEIPAVPVASIAVDAENSETSVQFGKTLQMNATILPIDASNQSIAWSVTDGTGSGTIDATGLFTGVSSGTATVVATANDGSGIFGLMALTIDEPIVLVEEVVVSTSTASTTIVTGTTLQMTATATPSNASDKTVTWSVENGTGTASIDSEGLLSASTVGTVTIIATANDASATMGNLVIDIIAEEVLVTNISVLSAGDVVVLEAGFKLQFTADILPANSTDKSVTWSVTNETGEGIISENGMLYGISEGTITISAVANDGTNILDSKQINVLAQGVIGIYDQEAENATIVGTTEIVTSCVTNSSGGAFVKLHDTTANSLTFDNIEVATAGSYRLAIYYFTATAQSFNLSVNGESNLRKVAPAHWCYEGIAAQHSVQIDLVVGVNTISISPEEGVFAPLIDRITVEKAVPSIVTFDVTTIRALINTPVDIGISVDKPVLAEQSFDIKVSGLAEGSYTLEPSFVTLGEGEDSAHIIFTALTAGSGKLVITNTSSEIVSIDSGLAVEITDQSNIIYISAEGNDLNDGLSESMPWKSLSKVSGISFVAGDTILFRAGDVFAGQLAINSSGMQDAPIVFGSYGEGDKPVIDGANSDGGAYAAAILIENQQFIEIRDLKITNDRKQSRTGVSDDVSYGIYVHNTSNNVIEYFRFINLNVEEIYSVSIPDEVNFDNISVAGIYVRSEQNNEVGKEKYVKDLLMDGCYVTHTGKFGFWSQHGGGASGVGDDMTNRNVDFVFRNNHFFELGGSGITPGRTYNCLVENNVFEYTGFSGTDPRLVGRGSGAWFFGCRNVVSQYNVSKHARGDNDSYGQHIDFGNEYVLLQYNYSEDSEGGFVEILGDNIYSTYRYNVSVNDGLREIKGNTLWVSTYSASDTPSDHSYIYNNSVFVGGDLTPDISIEGANTSVFNNIFYTTDQAEIGKNYNVVNLGTGVLSVDNNIFFGMVNAEFTNLDVSGIIDNPRYTMPGASNADGYKIEVGSPAINTASSFAEPLFPQAGIGIFKDITANATKDYFGNAVDLSTDTHIGAFNGVPIDISLPVVSLTLSQSNLNSGEALQVVAQLSKESYSQQSVQVTIPGLDVGLYTLSSGEISIAENTKEGSVTLTANADNQNETDQIGIVTLSAPSAELELGTNISSEVTVLKVEIITDVNNPSVGLSLYPNPVSDYIKIDLDVAQIKQVEIHSLEGQKVFETLSYDGRINVSDLKKGVYLVRIKTSDNRTYLSKILKE